MYEPHSTVPNMPVEEMTDDDNYCKSRGPVKYQSIDEIEIAAAHEWVASTKTVRYGNRVIGGYSVVVLYGPTEKMKTAYSLSYR